MACRFGADALAEEVDGHHVSVSVRVVAPECPAVAGGKALHQSADFVDRACDLVASFFDMQGRVGFDRGAVALSFVEEELPRVQKAAFEDDAEGDARFFALAKRRQGFDVRRFFGLRDAAFGVFGVSFIAVDADEVASQKFGGSTRRAGTEERIENDIARLGRRHDDAIEQGQWLLRRMDFFAVCRAQAFFAAANRQMPIAAHLLVVVHVLHRFVIEAGAGVFRRRRPDQRFMRVGKAFATEVGHGIVFTPHDIVQNPKTKILQNRADAEDVVIAADDPEATIGFQHALGCFQPVEGEGVISREIGEFVPFVVHGVDMAVVGAQQIAAQLEIIRRIGKNSVDRMRRKFVHDTNAVADQDTIQRQAGRCDRGRSGLRYLFYRTRHERQNCPERLITGKESGGSCG